MKNFSLEQFIAEQYGKSVIEVIKAFDLAIHQIESPSYRNFDATEILDSLKKFLTIFRMPIKEAAKITWHEEHYILFGGLVDDLYNRDQLDESFKYILEKNK